AIRKGPAKPRRERESAKGRRARTRIERGPGRRAARSPSRFRSFALSRSLRALPNRRGVGAGPMIRDAVKKVVEGRDLTGADAIAVMTQVMEGEAPPVVVGALLTALRMKGETPAEITG